MGSDRVLWARTRRACGRRVRQWAPRRNFALTLRWPNYRLECWYSPNRGYYPAVLYVHRQGVEHVFPMPTLDLRTVKKVNIRRGTASDIPAHIAAVESNVFCKLSSLVAHCCVTRYDDGEPRQPGWFTVKTYGSTWVVQVKDPDAAASLSCTASTLDDALALADLLLSTADAPWEPDRFLGAKNGTRKK